MNTIGVTNSTISSLTIGARKSDLARLQAHLVGQRIQEKFPEIKISYHFKESLGDKNLTDPLWKIPEKGVFTEDFYRDLREGVVDLVVHSWKDLPTETKSDTLITATLERADQRDLLLFKKEHFEKARNQKSVKIFSSSPRREYNLSPFLKTALPWEVNSVEFLSVRGNIPTRIKKLLNDTSVDALILAKAALDRLLADSSSYRELLTNLEWMVLPLSVNPCAAAQGALAIEVLKERNDLQNLLSHINHQQSYLCTQKEREILKAFGGGCHQKIGISILHRPYGEIKALKGVTDCGQILDTFEICTDKKIKKFDSTKLYAPSSSAGFATKLLRESIDLADDSKQAIKKSDAIYVSKAEAFTVQVKEILNNSQELQKYIWVAGTKTWKKLAQMGVWVHGCSDGLGESEEPEIEILAGNKLNWCKVTHRGALEDKINKIETYEVKSSATPAEIQRAIDGMESYYWMSAKTFSQALSANPEIINAYHACGPGHTFDQIKSILIKYDAYSEDRLNIFLTEQEWRLKCTKQ